MAQEPEQTSSLRGSAEGLTGGGKSSGLMSFLKIGDRSAGAIKSEEQQGERQNGYVM